MKIRENVNVNNVYLKEVPDAHAGLYLLMLFALVFKVVANKDIVFASQEVLMLYTEKGSEKLSFSQIFDKRFEKEAST